MDEADQFSSSRRHQRNRFGRRKGEVGDDLYITIYYTLYPIIRSPITLLPFFYSMHMLSIPSSPYLQKCRLAACEPLPKSQHITTHKRLRPVTMFCPMRMNHIMCQLMSNNSKPINRGFPTIPPFHLLMQFQKISNIKKQ